MGAYYDILIEYWKAGKVDEALKYFNEWKKAGLLSPEEIEKLSQKFPDIDELIIQKIDEEPEITHRLYRWLKAKKQWVDETLCKKLKITKKDVEKIKLHLPVSKKVRYKIFFEFINSLEE